MAAAEAKQKAVSSEAGDLEARHQAEVARLKAAMVELEKHLETRSRAEIAAKKKLAGAGEGARPPPPAGRPRRRRDRPAQGGSPQGEEEWRSCAGRTTS